ncbi:S-layer family protein [Halotia branconii]|uniref:S-layer family protein n=1 Tax=Halotia branconii CENA392 TaxID=1539056 RepID=A0AAJ6PA91_9CYAN|nr:S-layer family protein [Halotia branconii]WGV26502.1 S-layer family protein [Halotia branconii CENA392]
MSLTDGSQLLTSTSGEGNAGKIKINATDSVSISEGALFTETYSSNRGGDIIIGAKNFHVSNGSLLATVTYRQGNAGTIEINATDSVNISGTSSTPEFLSSRLYAFTDTNSSGRGGDIIINTKNFNISDGSELATGTRGQGNAGTIEINATDSVSIFGTSFITGASTALYTNTLSSGRGGDINIKTSTFNISNEAVLNAETINDGNGGNITVRANLFEVVNGGQLLSTSSGNGNAGKITVDATNEVIVHNSDATFNDRIAKFGTGKVANIENAASGLFVSSQGSGSAGDIEITSPKVQLDNSGRFIADSALGNGGNIRLQVGDLLLLRRSSLISATAGTDQKGGDGGNITINAPNGFIISAPEENSDITANAFSGSGGRITINATGIYGIAPLSREDFQHLSPDLDPSQVPTSNISAISQTNPTLSGTIELNTPGIDPNSGLIELPTIPVDTEVAQGCYSPAYAQSSFVNIGRGGLPANPKDILTPDATQIDWVSLKHSNNNRSLPPVTTKPTTSTPKRIVEATGATLNAKGQIVLSANSSTVTPHSSKQNPIQCHGS